MDIGTLIGDMLLQLPNLAGLLIAIVVLRDEIRANREFMRECIEKLTESEDE